VVVIIINLSYFSSSCHDSETGNMVLQASKSLGLGLIGSNCSFKQQNKLSQQKKKKRSYTCLEIGNLSVKVWTIQTLLKASWLQGYVDALLFNSGDFE
jgi:hypothetical protein